MALVDRIARQRRSNEIRRADPVTLEEFGYLLGRGAGTAHKTRAGVSMSSNRALGISAWYSGVRYISETVAGLPCKTFRDNAGERLERADASWKRAPWAGPDGRPIVVWFGLVEFWMMSLLHKGNAFAYKLRNPLGQVVGLVPVHPERVKVGRASDGTKVFVVDNDTENPYTAREILHVPGLSYDGVVGLNPIEVHAESLGLVAAADEYAGRAMDGNHLRAYLTFDKTLTTEQANAMKAQWDRMHRGLVNANEIAVIGGGAEYKTIDLDPQQLQLLESRKFGVTEVARILRLTPHKLYDLERATFSNIEQQAIEDVIDGIRPWCTRIEAWVNSDPDLLPSRNFIEWELEGLLRGDIKSRYEAYSAGIAGGFLQPAEPRAKENLPYVEGSEFLLRPLNMTAYGPDSPATPADPTPADTPQGAPDAPTPPAAA